MSNLFLSAISKTLIWVLMIQFCAQPFTAPVAHAAPSDDGACEVSRESVAAKLEQVLDDAGGEENWSIKDSAGKAISLTKVETLGPQLARARQFYVTTPEGHVYLVQTEANEGLVTTSISAKEGTRFVEVHKAEFRTGESSEQIVSQVLRGTKYDARFDTYPSPTIIGMLVGGGTLQVLLFLSFFAVQGVAENQRGSLCLFLAGMSVLGASILGNIAHEVIQKRRY